MVQKFAGDSPCTTESGPAGQKGGMLSHATVCVSKLIPAAHSRPFGTGMAAVAAKHSQLCIHVHDVLYIELGHSQSIAQVAVQ